MPTALIPIGYTAQDRSVIFGARPHTITKEEWLERQKRYRKARKRKNIVLRDSDIAILERFKARHGASHSETIRRALGYYDRFVTATPSRRRNPRR